MSLCYKLTNHSQRINYIVWYDVGFQKTFLYILMTPWRWRSSAATQTLSCRRATATGSARPSARDSSTRRLTGSRPTCQSRAGPQTESKMCLKSPGTDVGAAGFERCPRTFETHFTYGRGECLNLWKHTIVTVSNIVKCFMRSYYPCMEVLYHKRLIMCTGWS